MSRPHGHGHRLDFLEATRSRPRPTAPAHPRVPMIRDGLNIAPLSGSWRGAEGMTSPLLNPAGSERRHRPQPRSHSALCGHAHTCTHVHMNTHAHTKHHSVSTPVNHTRTCVYVHTLTNHTQARTHVCTCKPHMCAHTHPGHARTQVHVPTSHTCTLTHFRQSQHSHMLTHTHTLVHTLHVHNAQLTHIHVCTHAHHTDTWVNTAQATQYMCS